MRFPEGSLFFYARKEPMEYTKSELLFFEYAEEIARNYYNKNESMVIKPEMDEEVAKDFIERLISMEEIENVISAEDGLHIFFSY